MVDVAIAGSTNIAMAGKWGPRIDGVDVYILELYTPPRMYNSHHQDDMKHL